MITNPNILTKDKNTHRFMEKFYIEEVTVSNTFNEPRTVTLKLPYTSLQTLMDIVQYYEEHKTKLIKESYVRGGNPTVSDAYEKYQILLKLYE